MEDLEDPIDEKIPDSAAAVWFSENLIVLSKILDFWWNQGSFHVSRFFAQGHRSAAAPQVALP